MRADKRKYHIIYKTTCLVTGKWYIGMHSTDNLDDGYRGSGQLLWKSIKKHGKDQHVYEILEFLPSRKALSEREAELVTEKVKDHPECLNLRTGGTGNDPGFWQMSSEEKKAKASKLLSVKSKAAWARLKEDPIAFAEQLAIRNRPEVVAKRAAAVKAKGHKRTAEQIERLRAAQQSYYAAADEAGLKKRGQQAAKTRLERGTNKGGRPKGIPATESQKQSKDWLVQVEGGDEQIIRNLNQFRLTLGVSRNKLLQTMKTGKFVNGYRLIKQV